jgi:replication factor C subunit 1
MTLVTTPTDLSTIVLGIGKSSLAGLVAKSLEYDILEFNASDTRNKREIDEKLIESVSSKAITFHANSGFGSDAKRLIIMDEVDGMGGSDRGGISELIKVIKVSKIPIICICNDRQSQKVKSLANSCYDLKLKRPIKSQIANRLVSIGNKEGLQVDSNAAEMLVEQAGNDIRQALNALQMWNCGGVATRFSYGDIKGKMECIEKDKVLRQTPFDACESLLGGSKNSWEDRYNSFYIDYSLVPLLVQQNYIDSAKSGVFRNLHLTDLEKMEALSKSSSAVSDMDLFGSALRGQDQHWELLPAQAALSMKVGHHIHGFQQFPTFPMVSFLMLKVNLMVTDFFVQWLGRNSSKGKRLRFVNELVNHSSLSIGQVNKLTLFPFMMLDYLVFQ